MIVTKDTVSTIHTYKAYNVMSKATIRLENAGGYVKKFDRLVKV